MSIVVPEKFYIGFQKRERLEGEYSYYRDEKDTREKVPYLLGFATYLEDNKKFEKRKDTIDSWASGYRWSQDKEAKIPPRIIDNELQEGFYIPEEIRRCGSWSGGNVLWRIVDPRGFELEISSNNLAQLMECTNILKGGIIEGKCKWGWDMKGGSKVVLLPEDSEPYREALEHTEARKKSVKLSDVKMGDEVQLLDGTVGIYLGKHNMLYWDYGAQSINDHYSERSYNVTNIRRRAVLLVDTDKLYIVSEPKISYLKKETQKPYSTEFCVQKINEILKTEMMSFSKKLWGPQNSRLYGSNKPVMAFAKKPKEEDFQLVLVPLSYNLSELVSMQPDKHNEGPDGYIYTEREGSLLTLEMDEWGGYQGEIKKAKTGKIRLWEGIFETDKKCYGLRMYRGQGRYSYDNEKYYTQADDTWKWQYPAVKFGEEIFPLIWLPKGIK